MDVCDDFETAMPKGHQRQVWCCRGHLIQFILEWTRQETWTKWSSTDEAKEFNTLKNGVEPSYCCGSPVLFSATAAGGIRSAGPSQALSCGLPRPEMPPRCSATKPRRFDEGGSTTGFWRPLGNICPAT